MQSYTAMIEVSSSPDHVFACLQDVAKWWGGNDLDGSTSNLHDEFTIDHPGAHYSRQKIVEVIPEKRIVWLVTGSTLSWLSRDQHEWTNTKMIFDISTRGENTVLQFTHEGLVSQLECYSRCKAGWDAVINDWLFHFITKNIAHF